MVWFYCLLALSCVALCRVGWVVPFSVSQAGKLAPQYAVSVPASLFVCSFVCLSASSVSQSGSRSVSQSVSQSISQFATRSVSQSVCLSVCLFSQFVLFGVCALYCISCGQLLCSIAVLGAVVRCFVLLFVRGSVCHASPSHTAWKRILLHSATHSQHPCA